MTNFINVKSNTSCAHLEPKQCPECGSKDISMEEHRSYSQDVLATCSCDCDGKDDVIAAEKRTVIHCDEEHWTNRVNDPSFFIWNQSMFEFSEGLSFNLTVYCRWCYERSGRDDWHYQRSEVDPDDIGVDQDFTCNSCETEF
jgi:hypothetical protein